jgi:hypothetical protein
MKNKVTPDTSLAHTQKDGLLRMVGEDVHHTPPPQRAFRIAATKIGDDVESISTLSDICIYHLQLMISH